MVDPNPPIKRRPKNVPMLAFAMLAPVAAWAGYTLIGRRDVRNTSQGGPSPPTPSPANGGRRGAAVSTPAPSAHT